MRYNAMGWLTLLWQGVEASLLWDMRLRAGKGGSDTACSRHLERSLEPVRPGHVHSGTARTPVEVAKTL